VPKPRPDDLRLPHLETFARAAESGSFTAAARALRLTQAAVSQRVQALERELGTALFERTGGRVLLTDAGRRLYNFAQRILDLHRQAREAVAGLKAPVSGDLLLAASSVPGEHLLPALLSDFRRQHPHVKVRAAVGDSMGVLTQVERGEVSLGLVGRRTDNKHLEFLPFASDRLVLVVPPDHPLARRRKVTLKQLAALPLVLREAGSGSRHSFETLLEQGGQSPRDLNITLELGSNEAVKEAVARGAGVAVLSTFAVQKELKAGTLHRLEVSGLPLDRTMFVVQDRRRVLPLPARLFLVFLETHPATPSP
jgi:DNA-binding transcriptional LysR family regulator